MVAKCLTMSLGDVIHLVTFMHIFVEYNRKAQMLSDLVRVSEVNQDTPICKG